MALTAPSWQVDIPSLSQLVLNLGSEGLKQLASSGVDIHTVACMLKIGELVPACREYRKDLSAVRQKQRKSQIWLYKVIELGTATNFPADLLLKTRAGENVIALISAMRPMLPLEMCTETIELLFELRKTPFDEVPGQSQLRALCDTISPITLDMDVKDKIIQYSVLFHNLLRDEEAKSTHLFDDIIPTTHVLSQTIVSLHELVLNREDSVLIWPGFKGAAWLAVFAARILNLPTCALGPNGEVPINSAYSSAIVILDLNDTNGHVRTFQRTSAASVLELFSISLDSRPLVSGSRPGLATPHENFDPSLEWQFDCSQTSFISLFFPSGLEQKLFHYLSDVVAATTIYTIRTGRIGQYREVFWSQHIWIEPMITRGLEILQLLGFRVFEAGSYIYAREGIFENCKDMDLPVPLPLQGMGNCRDASSWSEVLTAMRLEDDGLSGTLAEASERATTIAEYLAGTDWVHSWGKLPLSALTRPIYDDTVIWRPELHSKGQVMSTITWRIHEALGLLFTPSREERTRSAAAFRCLGATFLRSGTDYRDRLWIQGMFYRIVPGSIRFKDLTFDYIMSDKEARPWLSIPSILGDDEAQQTEGFSSNGTRQSRSSSVPEIRAMAFSRESSIFLRLSYFVDSMFGGNIDCSKILDLLPNRYITDPCLHAFDTPCQFPFEGQTVFRVSKVEWKFSRDHVIFHSPVLERSIEIPFWFAPSDRCAVTQWALCATADSSEPPFSGYVALQLGTCTKCTLLQIAAKCVDEDSNQMKYFMEDDQIWNPFDVSSIVVIPMRI